MAWGIMGRGIFWECRNDGVVVVDFLLLLMAGVEEK